jgi:hypothetical protein
MSAPSGSGPTRNDTRSARRREDTLADFLCPAPVLVCRERCRPMTALYRRPPANTLPSARAPAPEATRDVAILGAGFTGLWAALTLARAGRRVVVLDAHRVGFGASGRNGGQVNLGFNSPNRELEAKLGEARARALWDLAEEARRQLRDFCKPTRPRPPTAPARPCRIQPPRHGGAGGRGGLPRQTLRVSRSR